MRTEHEPLAYHTFKSFVTDVINFKYQQIRMTFMMKSRLD